MVITNRFSWDMESPAWMRSTEKFESLADRLAYEIINRELRYKVHRKILEWGVDHKVPSLDSDYFSSIRTGPYDAESKSCAHLSPVDCRELRYGAKDLVLCIQCHGNRYTFTEHRYGECEHPDFRREK